MSLSLNSLAAQIHDSNLEAGWWSDCIQWSSKPAPIGYGHPREAKILVAEDPYLLATKISLIHSEVSEMTEGLRKDCQDDHLPHRKMEEVEAADIFIRLLDYCAARGFDIDSAIAEKRAYNARRKDHTSEARASTNGKKF